MLYRAPILASNPPLWVAIQPQVQGLSPIRLWKPLLGVVFCGSGSGSVPGFGLESPRKEGLCFLFWLASKPNSLLFPSLPAPTSRRVLLCWQLTPFYLPPTLLHYGHS
jgi:hypothetical protein